MWGRVGVALVAGVLVAGCSLGDVTVSKAELEKQVLAAVADGEDIEADVTCDGTLKGEVGATQECRVTDEAGTTGLHVKATKVDGTDVSFDLSPFIAAADVEEAIRGLAEKQGISLDTISCEGDLEGEKDATVRCSGTPVDTVGDLDVTVTSVEGLRVSFDVKPAG